jgi:copper(I)-binding protein
MAGMGEMTMQPVDTIDLPAGTAVSLKPGGYHIMLMNLAKPLEKGSSITLTLLLKTAGKLVIDLPVLDEAP